MSWLYFATGVAWAGTAGLVATRSTCFYTVQCDSCGIVLNSGHHYAPHVKPFAVTLAKEHNRAHHRQVTS